MLGFCDAKLAEEMSLKTDLGVGFGQTKPDTILYVQYDQQATYPQVSLPKCAIRCSRCIFTKS